MLRIHLAGILAVLFCVPAAAGPFAQVPARSWPYAECGYLAAKGVLAGHFAEEFAGDPLNRYQFASTLAGAVASLSEAEKHVFSPATTSDQTAAKLADTLARLGRSERARIAASLDRLMAEFSPELTMLLGDLAPARQAAARLASSSASSLAPGSSSRAGAIHVAPEALTSSLAGVKIGLSYSRDPNDLPAMSYMELDPNARSTGRSVTSESPMGTADVSVKGWRGSLEYGVWNFTLSLAYQALYREGYGEVNLDGALLKSLGLGYQISPSASLKLNYHLIDYTPLASAGERRRSELAEGELSIRF